MMISERQLQILSDLLNSTGTWPVGENGQNQTHRALKTLQQLGLVTWTDAWTLTPQGRVAIASRDAPSAAPLYV